ncbi:hypothetical protein [Peterkaempfera sp. SMS 1(5)a]|uniref:hypothetical protein n=1 Tax=Peterkaempfera podocarpi TaxID=3232308 RepID=UPI00366B1046
MTRTPGSDALLGRLLAHRRFGLGLLSQQCEVEESELREVCRGAVPDPALLRRIALLLDLPAADLFVIAGVPVPEDLMPLDATAGGLVVALTRHVVLLPPDGRSRLRQYVRTLPQERRTVPVGALRSFERYPTGFGGVLLRMLANRNLGWTHSAQVFSVLTGLYVSAATIGAVGRGRVKVTHDLLRDFAVVLGFPVGDLAAMAGPVAEVGGLPARLPLQYTAGPDMAGLIRELSRLTADQIRRVGTAAGVELR